MHGNKLRVSDLAENHFSNPLCTLCAIMNETSMRQAVKTLIERHCTLWISRQVIREYCRVLTHPTFPSPMPMKQAVERAK